MGPISAGSKALGALMEGTAGYEAGRFNARVAETNAVNSLRDSATEELRIRDDARKAMGLQVAGMGGGGLELGTGSALDLLMESASNATLDVLRQRRQGMSQAISYRTQGKLARAEGKNAMTRGIFGAVEAVAESASKAASAGAG